MLDSQSFPAIFDWPVTNITVNNGLCHFSLLTCPAKHELIKKWTTVKK